MNTLNKVKDSLFNKIHGNNLIYNACWEDPRIDRELLNIKQGDKIAMITSAGCNALDYLLDQPSEIHCVDMNWRQNAVLDLKKALFSNGDFQLLFNFFGNGFLPNASDRIKSLEKWLMPTSLDYWLLKSYYFSNEEIPFYHHGTSGKFARLLVKYLKINGVYKYAADLLNAETLEKQAKSYYKIEEKLFNGIMSYLISSHLSMTLLGVPRAQQNLLIDGYKGGITGFIKSALRHIFTQLPTSDNYFYRAYLNGSYSQECSPNYLKQENFNKIKACIQSIETHTSTLSEFLKSKPTVFDHFILLDHQDWLAAHNVPALEEEWEMILKRSLPGTKILMRSAAPTIDFYPEFVKARITFELIKEPHSRDRVGTYGCTYLGIVQ